MGPCHRDGLWNWSADLGMTKCDDDADAENLRFQNCQKYARHGAEVATTPAFATRKISALHPSIKQKFRIKL